MDCFTTFSNIASDLEKWEPKWCDYPEIDETSPKAPPHGGQLLSQFWKQSVTLTHNSDRVQGKHNKDYLGVVPTAFIGAIWPNKWDHISECKGSKMVDGWMEGWRMDAWEG